MTTPRQVLGNGMLLTCALLLIAGSALPAGAQVADARWQPWLGCWEAVGEPDGAPVLCLAPRSGESAIDMITLIDEQVVSRETIIADGQDRRVTREGCDGLERTEFSDDSHRLFFNSELVCEGDVGRKSSGVMSMSSFPFELLDVRAVEVDGQSAPWMLRYRIASQADFEAAGLGDYVEEGLSVGSARIAASALTLDQVIEASSKVDAKAVEAWIAGRDEPFALDASRLIRMADAGVPDGVIDVMIAVSYPEEFVLQTGDGEGMPLRAAEGRQDRRRLGSRGYANSFYDPFYDPYRYGRYSAFGYGRYGYGYGGYGYGGYGFGYGGYSVYNPGVVVVGRRAPESAGGRAVIGRGYTRGSRGSTGGVIPRGSSVRSSGGGAARSAPRAGSSSGGGRTAKPRRPPR